MADHKPPQDDEQRLSRIFSSLGDPTRRKIIVLLREAGELKIGHVAEAFEMSLNGVSKHLKVLERAGLVCRRIEGREHWIRVEWTALGDAHDWLDAHRHFWTRRLDALVDYLETEAPASDGLAPKKGPSES